MWASSKDDNRFHAIREGTCAWLVCGWRAWWTTVVVVLLNAAKFPLPRWRGGGYAGRQAKGAVVNLTRELGLEYARQGIQVNALCPGFYQTSLSRGAIDDPQVRATITAFIPMGRIAQAAEIKGPALFLASAASDYMTGQTLVTDGGCLAK